MNISQVAQTRYSTKKFDANKTISESDFEQIKNLLRFSPSSVNSQPWHFVIASTTEGKQRIAKATQGLFAANEAKVLDASHVIVFCAKTEIDDDYIQHIVETEEKDGRFLNDEMKTLGTKIRTMYVNMHRFDLKDAQHWMEKQVYLNMGTILLGAGTLGIDAVPIEGVDVIVLDEEFQLREKGYSAVALIALGYRHEQDANAKLPKSRLAEAEIISLI